MPIQRYDEAENLRRLSELRAPARVIFALLCAGRLLPAYRRFHLRTGRGAFGALASIADELWRDLKEPTSSTAAIEEALRRCLELIPLEEDGWDEATQPYAEAACAALAYALRARLSGDPREAAWAGRRACEAADHYVKSATGGWLDADGMGDAVLAHPILQLELARQLRDLDQLEELDGSNSIEPQLSRLRLRGAAETVLPLRFAESKIESKDAVESIGLSPDEG